MNNKEEAVKMLEKYRQKKMEGKIYTRGVIIGLIFGIFISSPCIIASFCGIFADDYLNSPEKYKVDTIISQVNSENPIVTYKIERIK